jgi:4-hydroxybenzoate polyprenyltransferase
VLAIRKYFEFVRFSHTVFALPFALASMVVAARANRGWPGWRIFLLILAAMVCARTAAMGFNRIVDRRLDALNPRTTKRHLPAGQIRLLNAWVLVIVSSLGLVYVAWLINPLCGYLSPLALLIVFFYSFTKRFTDFSHVFLGLALGIAPIGAWLAVRGRFDWPPCVLALAVVFWLVGFDIIYATQDWEFDKSQGLHSLPVRLGISPSLQVARVAHAIMAILLLAFGLISSLRVPYYLGLAVILVCLVAQHRLAKKRDPISLNVAFFRMNAVISAVFLTAVVVDVVLQ